MFRMLYRNFFHYWRSTCSVIVILLLIGISFIYALQTSDQMKVQAGAHLTDQWRTGYDLLVYPDQDEEKKEVELTQEGLTSDEVIGGLIRRGDMAQHGEGISLAQYEAIKAIEGVEVAAPLSFIGHVESEGITLDYGIEDEGFYFQEETNEIFDGVRYRDITPDFSSELSFFQITKNEDDYATNYMEIFEKGGWVPKRDTNTILRTDGSTWSMVAVDPVQEEKLLQMDQALVDGNLFDDHYELQYDHDIPMIPLILLNQPYDFIHSSVFYEIDVPSVMNTEQLIEAGGREYLETFPKTEISQVEVNPFSEQYLFNIGMIKFEDGNVQVKESTRSRFHEDIFLHHYSSSQYERTDMELNDGVPVVRALAQSNRGEQINYRNAISSRESLSHGFDIIGQFDVTLLENTYTTSDTPVPPDYYQPEDVLITHDVEGNEYDEPYAYASTPYKSGYYTGGIDAITTLVAAEYMLGDRPISLIRVIVDGVGERSPDSMAKVERVAEQIQAETGLNVDLMLGSADRKVHVLLDDYEGIPGYGYLLEGWSEEGASFVIEDRVSATTLSLTLFIVAMGLICLSLIYRNYTESRKRDMSVQYTFGWSKWKIAQSLAIESMIMILFIIGCLFVFKYTIGDTWAMGQFWLALIISISLTMLVMTFLFIIPILRFVEKNKTLRGASANRVWMSKRPRKTLWSHSVRNIFRHPVRSVAKLFIIMSTILYIFIFFISKQKSSSFLGLTFLGENIDAGLEKHQWVLFIVGIALAVSSYVAIHIHQTEARLREIQLFEAWGWKSSRWRALYLLEETFLNIVAVCVGITLSVGILTQASSVINIKSMDIGLYVGIGFILTIGLSASSLFVRSKGTRLREFQ